jgi:hypothetical protein
MLAMLVAAVIAQDQGSQQAAFIELAEPDKRVRTAMRIGYTPLEPPKLSPHTFGPTKQRWEFPFIVDGFGPDPGDTSGQRKLRLRVFSQLRKETADPAISTARMAIRLWDLSIRRIGIDHPMAYNRGIVDFYLAYGGQPGGEQRFGVDVEAGVTRNVNVIYIYQLQTFTDPVEMAREIAHEYGHAVLPPIGGYSEPEDWANGHLGELVFLSLLAEEMRSGRLQPRDAMGATLAQIEGWLTKNAYPLAIAANQVGPNPAPLRKRDKAGMDAYLGLALLMHSVLPDRVFGRSTIITGSERAEDYLRAIVHAAEEPNQYELKIPAYLQVKNLWIPLGKASLTGGSIVRRSQDKSWALVTPKPDAKLVVTNRSE